MGSRGRVWIMQGKFTDEAGCEPEIQGAGGNSWRRKSHLTEKPARATGLL